MEDPQPGISSRVKRLRTERAWSQEQLAEICGVSVRTIQRLETGEKMSFETLKAIATAFDLDVRDLTEAQASSAGPASSPENEEHKKPNIVFVRRITSGNELYGMIGDAHAYRLQNDELDTAEEVELVGSFLQDVRDSGDLGDMEPMEKVAQGYRFTQMISELDGHGLWVFGGRTKARYRPAIADMQAFTWVVVNVLVLRSTNPTIIKKAPAKEVVAVIIDA
jgi:transcriptional regulator with XRE-family HTH domain